MAEGSRRALGWVIGAVVVAVLALVAIFVVVPALTSETETETDAYEMARAEYSDAWTTLQDEMGEADAVLSDPGAADQSLVEDLRTAFNAGAGLVPLEALPDDSHSDPAALDASTAAHLAATTEVQQTTETLVSARDALEAAVEGAASGTARPQSTAAIAAADAALTRSEGRVPEDLRTALDAALTDARALESDAAAASADLTAAMAALDAARAAVDAAVTPVAGDANGEWCLHFEHYRCVTIEGASISDSVYGGAQLQGELTRADDGCFRAEMIDPNSQPATFAYCPPGSAPAGFAETLVNHDYERIYIMGTPAADPWFRAGEIAAATASSG